MTATRQIIASRRRPWRLRTRFALALLSVFIPIAILVSVTHVEDLNDRRQSRVESFATIGDTIAADVDGFARDLESFSLSTAITLGEVSAYVDLNQSMIGPYFQHLMDSYGILRAIFITDLNGHVVATSTGEMNGFDLSSRSYIKALQNGRDSTWSGALAGSISGQTTMAYGRTVRTPDGAPRFYFIVAFYPSQLATRLPQDLPEDANVTLVDENGIVLFSTREMPESTHDISAAPVFQAARAGGSVLVRSDNTPVDEDKRYGAFVQVPRMGWVVGFTRPADAIDGPLETRFRRDMLIICALLIAGFVATLIIASRLSRPLSTLARTARAITRGEHAVIPIAAADAEVAELQSAMETMSLAVADREEQLKMQAQVLQTLELVGEQLATELDFDKAVASISHAALDLTQAEAAAFFYRDGESAGELTSLNVAAELPEGASEPPIDADDPLVLRALKGEVVHSADLALEPAARRRRLIRQEPGREARSALAIPVTSRDGAIYGAFVLLHSRPDWFNADHEGLAVGLSRRASIIVENARLYSEARAVQDELRRANVGKDEFIGLMSHELRTPITTIYGGARLLHARRSHLPEQDVDDMIGSIEEEAERLYRLVENLLALARAELAVEPARQAIALAPVIEQSVRQFGVRRPARPLEVDTPADLPPTLAETTYVQQMLHNLITNADKYSDGGLPIEIKTYFDDKEVTVNVADHGPGVAPDEIGQIFDSFFRSQRTAKQAGGKGLGLTVCKRLAEAMGGRIWAENREGGGLSVSFTLPVAPDQPAERQTVAPGSSKRG